MVLKLKNEILNRFLGLIEKAKNQPATYSKDKKATVIKVK